MAAPSRRLFDAFVTERLWRAIAREEVCRKVNGQMDEAGRGLGGRFGFYAHDRPDQSLGHRTPWDVYFSRWGDGGHVQPSGAPPRVAVQG